MKQVCPVCTMAAVGVSGPSNSRILIILSHPDWADIKYGYPFATDKNPNKWQRKVTAGEIMQKECARAGLDLNAFRVCCLYPHQDTKDKRCFELGRDATLEEARDKQAILLVGAQAVTFFTGQSVNDVNGLPLESGLLSAPIIYPLVTPASVLLKGAGVGEIRFGLSEFASRLKQENLI